MRRLMVIMLLLSACRFGHLAEEPVQQVKSLKSGDVVFDAQDITKTAVNQCDDNGCRQKNVISYMMHHTAISSEQIKDTLQLDNLHVSFQSGEKTYTCLRVTAPLGKMTLLLSSSGDGDKHCYGQAKDKDKAYVMQFAAACIAEEDAELLYGKITADNLKKFACKTEDVEVSSDCFAKDSTAECDSSSWPDSIKAIHTKAKAEAEKTTAKASHTAITADTKLQAVKVMAEWKLAKEVTCDFAQEVEFEASDAGKREIKLEELTGDNNLAIDAVGDNKSISLYDCADSDSSPFEVDYFIPSGACINEARHGVKSLDACDKETNYIKITFEAK